MPNTNCTIITKIKRPNEVLVEAFRNLPVANVDDCMNRMAAISSAIRPMNQAKLLGAAFTVKVPDGDNLMLHKAMDMAGPGDILMIDAGGGMNRAILGELMISYCKLRGISGIVVDGCIRDCEAVSLMDYPVYARGISPNGPYKNGPGEINTTIVIGGIVVRPGDIVLGDADGVIVIKPEEAIELAQKARDIMEKESGIMETMQRDGTYLRPWVDEKLAEIGCDIISF